jgi:hypothetical protein
MDSLIPDVRDRRTRNGKQVLDLTFSANLYLTPAQGRAFEEVLDDPLYKSAVSAPLEAAADTLPFLLERATLSTPLESITVIDCGPATHQEAVRKLEALANVVKVKRYVVVDINSRLLTRTKAGVCRRLGIPVTTLKHRFEDLDRRVLREHAEGDALLLFGSTGMNYEQDELENLLQRLCFPGMFVSLENLIHSRDGISKGYESDAVIRFAFGPISLLGGTIEQFEFKSVNLQDRVRLEFRAKERVKLQHAHEVHLEVGDRVWTAFSRRPLLSEHQLELARITDRFDTVVLNNAVAASLGRFG